MKRKRNFPFPMLEMGAKTSVFLVLFLAVLRVFHLLLYHFESFLSPILLFWMLWQMQQFSCLFFRLFITSV
jgi:hypothetical protein